MEKNKKILLLGMVFLFCNVKCAESEDVVIQAHQTRAVPLVLALIGHETQESKDRAVEIIRFLEFTGLFSVSVVEMAKHPHRKDIESFGQKGILFVALEECDKTCEMRIYQTKNAQFLKGERVEKRGDVSAQGKSVADELFFQLTGQKGCAESLIVYCKRLGKNKTQICVADYDGSHEKVVTTIGDIAVAPRWNNDSENPFILYSEYTAINLALMFVDLKGNKHPAVNFDGINMQAAFSPKGDKVLVCLSVEGSTHIYRCVNGRNKRKFIRLTHGKNNNISPVYVNEHTIVYCSDRQGSPAIYSMDEKGKNNKRISSGTATAPAYSEVLDKIGYIEFIKGVAHIVLHDLKTNEKEYITNDSVHKEDLSFSPCGNFVAFSIVCDGNQQVVVQSLLTGKRTFITPAGNNCGYPCWSGRIVE